MAKTIVQKIVYKNTTPKALYDLYMNAEKHSLIAGGAVTISDQEGTSFSAHGGYITGKNIHLVKDRQIVQTWRAQNWDAADADSIFTITLEPKGKDVTVEVVHAGVPRKFEKSIEKGWHDHYWKPWKQHLAGKTIKRPKM